MVERLDFVELVEGTRFHDRLGQIAIDEDGNQIAHLIDLTPGEARVLFAVPAPDANTVHPSLDGGLHVLDLFGRMHTYDADGALVSEVETGAENVFIITMDESTGRLAFVADRGTVVLFDPDTEVVEALPTLDSVANLGIGRNGELLLMTGYDGTVRAWDLKRGESAGLVWDGTGAINSSPSWYDATTDSMWVFSSGRLLQIPIDPQQWIDRACEIVGRELTDDEWSSYVPGALTQQPVC